MGPWKMYAHDVAKPGEPTRYFHISENRRTVQMYGVKDEDILEVLVTEDENGKYLGWLEKDRMSHVMIERLFPMQFPYKPDEYAVHRGAKILRLNVAEV
jgi:hypothetical protein